MMAAALPGAAHQPGQLRAMAPAPKWAAGIGVSTNLAPARGEKHAHSCGGSAGDRRRGWR